MDEVVVAIPHRVGVRGGGGGAAVVIEWLVHYNFAYHIFIEDNTPLHCDYADMFHVYIK